MALSQPLDQFLVEAAHRYRVPRIPDTLAANTGKIYERIFEGYPNRQTAVSVGLASIYTWSYDNLWDDPLIPREEKRKLMEEQSRLLEPHDLRTPIPADDFDPACKLLADGLNGILENVPLTGIDRFAIKEQFRRTFDTQAYDLFHVGPLPSPDELSFFASYNYSTPFYGFLIYVSDFHLQNAADYARVDHFLYLFGLLGRLWNDLQSYERERTLGELNMVLVLEQQLDSLPAAVEQTKRLIEQTYAAFSQAENGLPSAFVAIIQRFEQCINAVYREKDFRQLGPTELDTFKA